MSSVSDSGSLASTTPTATTTGPSTPSATGQSGAGQDSIFPNTSASLYLYTFLATLVLLLGVSGAIVFRSLLLRRRQRRIVEEAIRNGTYVPPAPAWGRGVLGGRGRGPTVDLKNKPKMWEAWLDGPQAVGTQRLDQEIIDEKLTKPSPWQGLMPVSLLLLKAPESNVPISPPAAQATSTAPLDPSPPPRSRFDRFMDVLSTSPSTPRRPPSAPADSNESVPPWVRRDSDPPPPMETEDLPPQTLPAQSDTPATVRVTLLIAMPTSEPFSVGKRGEDGELPHLEVGSIELEVPPEEASSDRGEKIQTAPGEDGA